MLFGIPADKVDNAVSNKQLTSLTPEIREPTIRGDQLLDWVDSAKVETVLTIAAAATIARRRKFLTDNPELPERVPTIVDAAFATVGKIEAAEQAEKAERRSELLSRYRAVVCRHASPLDGDAAELATLVRELGYTRSDIDSDIVALKKVSELEPYSTDEFFRQSNSEMESAVANRKTVEQRHKEETAAAQSRESKARSNLHLALRAGSEINSIKTERRELFGT
jgi:hypothetical protein